MQTNYERIKSMSIEEMAKELTLTELLVMQGIKETLVLCLPLPDDERVQKMIKETREWLESEVE